jgi:hypothetical protein
LRGTLERKLKRRTGKSSLVGSPPKGRRSSQRSDRERESGKRDVTEGDEEEEEKNVGLGQLLSVT